MRDEMLMRGINENLLRPVAPQDHSSNCEFDGQTQLTCTQPAMPCSDENADAMVKMPSEEAEVPFSAIRSSMLEVDTDSKSSEGESHSSGVKKSLMNRIGDRLRSLRI